MKAINFIAAVAAGALLLASCTPSIKKTSKVSLPAPQVDSASYAMGVWIGNMIKSEDFGDLNYSKVNAGIADCMVLFEDNSVGLYTLEGNLYKNWRGIECKETIKHLPEPMEIGGKRYWVLRTPMQTLICRFDGTAAATFEKNSRLKPKSEITPMQGSQVRVNCYDGKNYILDLEKGTFKRIKK